MFLTYLAGAALLLYAAQLGRTETVPPVEMRVVGDWQIEVTAHTQQDGADRDVTATFSVQPPEETEVKDERHDSLPDWNPAEPGWARTGKLLGIQYDLYTARFALDEGSLRVRSAADGGPIFEAGKDYAVDVEWSAIGRLPQGHIGPAQPVSLSYRFRLRRLDSVILTRAGKLILREGKSHVATPLPPALEAGETRLANIWLPATLSKLGPDNLFPILETAYPAPPKSSPTVAEQLLPKTMEKLRDGTPLKILAWGDSVTAGYMGDDQWQAQFVRRLKARFPKANITLITNGWGAHTSDSFVTAPSGHPCNYKEKILGVHPDLVVSEFVNDLTLTEKLNDTNYAMFLRDFKALGTEWIILMPHYIGPEWMGLTRERDIDTDPRPLVPWMRAFAAQNHVALADANLRYGRLWRLGIPFTSLMVNTINHPNAPGMAIFADSLMWLFP
jgi:hypothetical protein